MGLDEAVELAITRTRQFAVRQERWFRRDPRIVWVDATEPSQSVGGGAEPAGRLVTMHLSKHHGLGNDFLVLLRDDVVPMPDDVAAALAIRLCHRTRGIGADGLLIGGPPVRRIACDLQMWLYNADGSRAEMSGNGIRCLAQAVLRDRGLTEATLAISTDGGLRRVDAKVVSDDEVWASVDMGAMSAIDAPNGWHVLDLDPLRPVAHLSIGNPHAVVLVDDADDGRSRGCRSRGP